MILNLYFIYHLSELFIIYRFTILKITFIFERFMINIVLSSFYCLYFLSLNNDSLYSMRYVSYCRVGVWQYGVPFVAHVKISLLSSVKTLGLNNLSIWKPKHTFSLHDVHLFLFVKIHCHFIVPHFRILTLILFPPFD